MARQPAFAFIPLETRDRGDDQAGSFMFPFNGFQHFRHGVILKKVMKIDLPILSNPDPDLPISAATGVILFLGSTSRRGVTGGITARLRNRSLVAAEVKRLKYLRKEPFI